MSLEEEYKKLIEGTTNAEEEYEKWLKQYFIPEVADKIREDRTYMQTWCSGYESRSPEVGALRGTVDTLVKGWQKCVDDLREAEKEIDALKSEVERLKHKS